MITGYSTWAFLDTMIWYVGTAVWGIQQIISIPLFTIFAIVIIIMFTLLPRDKE